MQTIKKIAITTAITALFASTAFAGNGSGQQHQYKGSNSQSADHSGSGEQKKHQYKGSKEGNGDKTMAQTQTRTQTQTMTREPIPYAN
ncbi:hypothetical protein THMIRHAS_01600 [Thiosulfatimonas sediminis]|uniref:Uncharacterized protein n=1 Tax=Thiosulfatimonas sediminis TaxID=2675054 RepID=A0A6F8PRX7_9GAMM|nr:hypothetical protein [Thiosulfatimonas sediminis]BBP44787.1 hypothetical protein THMIRHAS_01600 [Thiosulfatimonas sediminis]